MTLFNVFNCLILLVVFILTFFYLPSYLSTFLLTQIFNRIIKLALRNTIKNANFTFIRIYPILEIHDWVINLKANREIPETTISFKSLQISIKWKILLNHIVSNWFNDAHYVLDDSKGVIQIDLIDFHIYLLGLRFKDVLNPSNKSMNKILDVNDVIELIDIKTDYSSKILSTSRIVLYLMRRLSLSSHLIQQFALLLRISFTNISYDMRLTSQSAESQASASSMEIYFNPLDESNSINGVVIAVDISKGEVDVHQNNDKAFAFFCDSFNVRVDYHLPSGMMKTNLKLEGNNVLDLTVDPFLNFYNRYQIAEDDAIEVKFTRSLDTSGKMYEITANFATMRVSLHDNRVSTANVLDLVDFAASINTYKLTKSGLFYLKGLNRIISSGDSIDKSSDSLSPNIKKILRASVGEVRWPYHNKSKISTAFVKDVQMCKQIKVINEENYIDIDSMAISASEVNFQRVNKSLFEWLIILQDLTNRLPSSRFAHYKSSLMSCTIKYVTYSMNPYFTTYSNHLFNTINGKANFNSGTLDTHVFNNQSTNECSYDELIIICSRNNHIVKQSEPMIEVSPMTVTIESLDVHCSYQSTRLEYLYNIKVESKKSNRIGLLFHLFDMKINLTSGPKISFVDLNLSDGLTMYMCDAFTAMIPSNNIEVFASCKGESNNFFKSTRFYVKWSGTSPTFNLGDVLLHISIYSYLKFQSIFNMMRDFNNIVQSTMNKYKTVDKLKSDTITKVNVSDIMTTIVMSRIKIDLLLSRVELIDQQMREIKQVEAANLTLDFDLIDLIVVMSTYNISYRFNNCNATINKHFDKPFLNVNDFYYSINKSTSVGKIQRENLTSGEIRFGLSTDINMSDTLEALMNQYDAYKTCMSFYNRSPSVELSSETIIEDGSFYVDNPIHSVLPDSNHADLPLRPSAFTMESIVKSVEIAMDSSYNNEYVANFCTMKWSNITCSLDGSQREVDMYSNISYMDFIGVNSDDVHNNRFVMYKGVIGGYIKAIMTNFDMTFAKMTNQYVAMIDITMDGDLYMAIADDSNIQMISTYIQLPDLFGSLDEDYLVETIKSTASSKLYSKLQCNINNQIFVQELVTTDCLNIFSQSIPQYLPTNRDLSPPLAWWDNLSYWLHGSINFSYKIFQYQLILNQNLMQCKLCFQCNDMKLALEPGAIECSMTSVFFDAITSDNMTSRRIRFNNYSNENIHRIVVIAAILITCQTTSCESSEDVYNHHDVYLSPSTSIDKYSKYRVKPNSLQFEIEMLCCDTSNEPITINCRLDVLLRILDSFNNMNSVSTTSQSKSPPISSLIRRLDLQIGVNTLLISSWSSARKLGGIVYFHKQMDLQLRLSRRAFKSNDFIQDEPLEVEHLYVDIGYVDVYIREWDLSLDTFNNMSTKNTTPMTQRLSRKLSGRFKSISDSTTNDILYSNSTKSFNDSIEPKSVDEIKRLLSSNCKLIYLSRIEISLTEDRDMLGTGIGRSTTFCDHGVICQFTNKSKSKSNSSKRYSDDNIGTTGKAEYIFTFKSSNGVVSFIIGRDKRRSKVNKAMLLIGLYRDWIIQNQLSKKVVNKLAMYHQSESRRPSSLVSFRTDRDFIIEKLTEEEIRDDKWRGSIDGYRPSILSFAINHTALSPPFSSLPDSYQSNRYSNSANVYRRNNANNLDNNSKNYINKIWGLRMVDTRLLWTIDIRDILFSYVSRYFELFMRQAEVSTKEVKNLPNKEIVIERKDETKVDTELARESIIISKTPSLQRDKAEISLKDFLGLDKEINANTLPKSQTNEMLTPIPISRSLDSSNSPANSLSPLLSPVEKSFKQEDVKELRKLFIRSKRGSLFNKSLDSRAISSKKSSKTIKTLPTNVEDANESVDKADNKGEIDTKPIKPTLKSDFNFKSKNNHSTSDRRTGSSSKFFIIELIDPQINFLDVESHSSVIIVTGRSYLEGSRNNIGYINERNKGKIIFKTARSGLPFLLFLVLIDSCTPQRMSEIRLQMDAVSAYTVPTMLSSTNSEEGTASQSDVIHWKMMNSTTNNNQKQGTPAMSESPYIKVAIKDFKIRALYTFWSNLAAEDHSNLEILIRNEEFVCSFLLDLPEIIIDTDSSQFYIIINVLRNVLLVPPPPLPRYIQLEKENKESDDSLKWITIIRDPEVLSKQNIRMTSMPLNIKNKSSKEEIKVLIEESLDRVFDVELGMARLVEIFIGRGTWILRTHTPHPTYQSSSGSSHSGIELVETGFTGVYATFTFHEDRSASVLFETQRFWARNISISPNGNSGDSFGNLSNDMTWIMMPILNQTEPCVRCGVAFNTETNDSNSCVFHADENGAPGEYKQGFVIDELTRQSISIDMWTCCGNRHANAPGCSSRPHLCKEVMISIRAEANPSVKIEKIHLSVLNTLEISFFPGASYDLQVQITKRLVDILHHFFSLEAAASDYADLVNDLEKEKDKDLDEEIVKAEDARRSSIDMLLGTARSSISQIRSSGKPDSKESSKDRHLSVTSPPPKSILSNRLSSNQSESAAKDQNETVQKQEGIYIRYMRVGDIYVYVSTAGFILNVDKSRAVVEPFFCRGEVLDWHGLIVKLERHATWSVTKNIASESLNRLSSFVRSKFILSNHIMKDKHILEGDEEYQLTSKRALILGDKKKKKNSI